MIQRIQTLYLFVAAVLMSMMLIFPLAIFSDGTAEFSLRAFAISDDAGAAVQSTIYMGILLAVGTALPFVTIFLFRNRMLQVRLCVVEAVLLVGALVMTAIYCWLGYKAMSALPFGMSSISLWTAMPIIALVLDILAARAIFKDEVLVRSLDRIR